MQSKACNEIKISTLVFQDHQVQGEVWVEGAGEVLYGRNEGSAFLPKSDGEVFRQGSDS